MSDVNLVIMISAIAVLSLSITMIYNWYIFDQKQQGLEKAGSYVNELVNKLGKNEISQAEFTTSLDAMGYISDAKIYVIRIDKESLANPKTLQLGNDLAESYLIGDLRKILDGGKQDRQALGGTQGDIAQILPDLRAAKKDKNIDQAKFDLKSIIDVQNLRIADLKKLIDDFHRIASL